MRDVLSQDEIDALLNGVDEGAVGAGTNMGSAVPAEAYDLTSGISRIKGWIQDIELINEKIQNTLSLSLLGLLHKKTVVKRQEVVISKFSDYVKTLYMPTSINAFSIEPLNGVATIVLNSELVFSLVNVFFGGGARPVSIEGREFTQAELRVITIILDVIIDSLKAGWKQLDEVQFEQIESEMNPVASHAYASTDVLMISPFSLEFDGGGGEVQVIMPGSVVDAIFMKSNYEKGQGKESWESVMQRKALDFNVNVTGELGGASLNLQELFKLAKGDIVAIDAPDEVFVKVNGSTKYTANMGEIDGRVGLMVKQRSKN